MSSLLRPGWRREVIVFTVAYLFYSLARELTIGDLGVAKANAHQIHDLEGSLDIDVEDGVQTALSGTAVLWLLNNVYLAAQLVVVPAALVWLYRRSPRHYTQLRTTVLATWVIAVPVYALYPCAPPRLADLGLVDTITSQTGVALDSKLTTSFYNPLAAVPSLHAGFALAVSAALAAAATKRTTKLLAWLWAPTVMLAVVATGNHFVFDIAAGVVATLAGFVVGAALSRVQWPAMITERWIGASATTS